MNSPYQQCTSDKFKKLKKDKVNSSGRIDVDDLISVTCLQDYNLPTSLPFSLFSIPLVEHMITWTHDNWTSPKSSLMVLGG